MKIGTAFQTLAFALAAIAMTGCGGGGGNRPASFNAWQTQMQAYVANEGNGDMNALRDARITPAPQGSPSQPGFRAFSNDRPEQSKDIAGVLVGVRQAGDRIWYVYLAGEIDREQVGVMRLVAVSQVNGQYNWRVGADEANASAAYRLHREQVWKSKHGGDSSPPRSALSFPSSDDQFTLSESGENLMVRESASGAQWTLNLAEASPKNAEN